MKHKSLICSMLFTVGLISFGCSAIYAQTSSEAINSSVSVVATYQQIEKLVREFYPKAKISVTDQEIHFEYKAKNAIGYYTRRPVFAPDEGGILGDVTLRPGEYTGRDKSRLDAEENQGFYLSLKLAPYSRKQNSHLLATLLFPQETPADFKDRFKDLINNFNADEEPQPQQQSISPSNTETRLSRESEPGEETNQQAKSTPPAVAITQTVPGSSPTPQATKAEWLLLQPADMGFSVKVPTLVQPTVSKQAEMSSNDWQIVSGDATYVISVFKYPPDQFDTKTFLARMVEKYLNTSNQPHDVTVNGFKGIEVSTAKEPDLKATRNMYFATPGYGYVFAAGYAGEPKTEDQFFNSIKIDERKYETFASIARPEVSFKIPTGYKINQGKDTTGTGIMWTGSTDGVFYMVSILTPYKPFDTEAQRKQALDAEFTVLRGKESKLEKEYMLQGSHAREYSFVDPKTGSSGKAVIAVSSRHRYLFFCGGDNYIASRFSAPFFNAINIGK